LRSFGIGLAGLGLWLASDKIKQLVRLPGADRRFTGSYETGSFTGLFPRVSWIVDRPPPVDPDSWQLRISGAVEESITLTYQQLLDMVREEVTAVLDCTGGWFSEQEWSGVAVSQLLALANPTKEALSVTFEAVSGYKRRFGIREAQDFLLATAVAGHPLPHGHGFPTRLVAPGQRGVNWVKWISHIRVNTTGKHWQLPLPLQ
jgi:DMSO/TMAO reductase YedYZ molybdopterin-dependent catalytic subunit